MGFPVFTKTAQAKDMVDETHVAERVYAFLFAGIAWGISMAVFMQPVEMGVVCICLFLLTTAVVTAVCMQFIPLQLGSASRFVTEKMIMEAGNMCKDLARERRQPFVLH